jgi:hypothetical protein
MARAPHWQRRQIDDLGGTIMLQQIEFAARNRSAVRFPARNGRGGMIMKKAMLLASAAIFGVSILATHANA